MPEPVINKGAINVNRTTNATGLLSAIGAIGAGWDGIIHGRPVGVWLPMVFMGLSGAIAQWLQGEPTPTTKLIANVLRLDGTKTNAELIRGAVDRLLNSGAVPSLGTSGPTPDLERFGATPRRGNEGLNANTLESIANDVGNYDTRRPNRNSGTWVSVPESIEPNTPQARTKAWRDVDALRGRTIDDLPIGPGEFAAFSQSGDEDDDSGPPSQAWDTPIGGGF